MNEKKTGRRSIAALVGGVLLIVIGIAMIGMSVFVDSMLGMINRVEQQETLSAEQIQAILAETDPVEIVPETDPVTETVAPTEEQTEAPTEATTEPATEYTEPTEPATEPIPTETVPTEPEPIVNILLVGQDRRINQPRQRSDAMILCTINVEKKTVTLTSFLRDTYVKLPGTYGMNKLNAAYLIGGFDMLDRCLKENFGVRVDHNIEVDFSGFKAVIDAMGGIDIELTAKEAEIVEGDQVVGMNHLDGGQALMYARIRKIDDDFERTNRQRKVLTVLFEKIKTMNLIELLLLSNELLPMITTDMTDEELLEYMLKYAPLLGELKIITQSVPDRSEFEYEMIDGMSVVVPYMNRIRKKLAETIGS